MSSADEDPVELRAWNALLSERARAMRKARKLTLQQVADATAAAGVPLDVSIISKLERDQLRWNLRWWWSYTKALEVVPEALMLDVEEQSVIRALRTGGPALVIQVLAAKLHTGLK